MPKELTVIGHNVLIDFIGHVEGVPAKVDTGADISSVWVSNIEVSKDGQLSFVLFDKGSKHYTGEVINPDNYSFTRVVSSTGHKQIRYTTKLLVSIADKKIMMTFSLSNRAQRRYPVLIGRRSLLRKFVVDVAKKDLKEPPKVTHGLYREFKQNPYEFHEKYHGNQTKK